MDGGREKKGESNRRVTGVEGFHNRLLGGR